MNEKRNIVFGGKGFIGQNLAREIVLRGEQVLIVDKNKWELDLVYSELRNDQKVQVLHADIVCDFDIIASEVEEFSKSNAPVAVWHLAANSDILNGNRNLSVDLNDTFLTTVNILRLCEKINIGGLYFASSSAVYGSFTPDPNGLKENDATCPISNYGAMKLASEAVIRAANQNFVKRCIIFRFPNVIGYPATHGVISDFIEKLKTTPNKLTVLGDGKQNKPYLHVKDLVDAMLYLVQFYNEEAVMETINVASPHENVFVWQIAEEVRSRVSPNAEITFGVTPHGWIGDMPAVNFNIDKILSSNWKCNLSGIDAVRLTIDEIINGEKL